MGEGNVACRGSMGTIAEAKVKLLVVVVLKMVGAEGIGIVGIERTFECMWWEGLGRKGSSYRTDRNRDGEVEEEPWLVVDVAVWAVVTVEVIVINKEVGMKRMDGGVEAPLTAVEGREGERMLGWKDVCAGVGYAACRQRDDKKDEKR